jgi:hypothetical protein
MSTLEQPVTVGPRREHAYSEAVTKVILAISRDSDSPIPYSVIDPSADSSAARNSYLYIHYVNVLPPPTQSGANYYPNLQSARIPEEGSAEIYLSIYQPWWPLSLFPKPAISDCMLHSQCGNLYARPTPNNVGIVLCATLPHRFGVWTGIKHRGCAPVFKMQTTTC